MTGTVAAHPPTRPSTRTRWWALGTVAAVVLAVLVTLAAVVVWRELRQSLTPRTTAEVCSVDESLSGFQGWCVQRRDRAGGLLTDDQSFVYVVGVRDGQELARVTYAPWPFVGTDDELDVRFEPDRIVLTSDQGVEVAYPASYYALD